MPFIRALRRNRQEDHCEVHANLIYQKTNSRTFYREALYENNKQANYTIHSNQNKSNYKYLTGYLTLSE